MTTLSVDEFRAKIDASKVKCMLCPRREHSLVAHLRDGHNLSVGQYQKQFPGAQVASPVVLELLKQGKREAKLTDELTTFLPQFIGAATTTDLVKALKPSFGATTPENQHLIPTENPSFVLEERTFKATAFALMSGKNVYVEGPTGCGKTDGMKQIHAKLGLPLKRVNMNGDITVANFIGKMHADPQKGTYYKYGNLPLAMQQGYTLLIDEIDYCPPSIAAVLNPVLEGAKELYLPETDERIEAAKGFCVIGLANTGGKGDSTGVYNGTEILNTAFLDRFAVKLTVDYLPADAEITMLTKRFPHLAEGRAVKLVTAARDVREQFKNGLIPVTMSTRKLIDVLEMEPALGFKEAMNCALLNWLDDDNVELVRKTLENHGLNVR